MSPLPTDAGREASLGQRPSRGAASLHCIYPLRLCAIPTRVQPFVFFLSLNHAFGIIFYENYLSLRFQVVDPDVSCKEVFWRGHVLIAHGRRA